MFPILRIILINFDFPPTSSYYVYKSSQQSGYKVDVEISTLYMENCSSFFSRNLTIFIHVILLVNFTAMKYIYLVGEQSPDFLSSGMVGRFWRKVGISGEKSCNLPYINNLLKKFTFGETYKLSATCFLSFFIFITFQQCLYLYLTIIVC